MVKPRNQSDKSPGVDGIPNRIPQAGGEKFIISVQYCVSTTNIWEIETYPEEWTKSLMQPIYKGAGKDRKNPESYRGICLTCAITKLFEGLIQNRFAIGQQLVSTNFRTKQHTYRVPICQKRQPNPGRDI